MPRPDDLKYLLDEIVVFKRNLDKDNLVRRQNLQTTRQKLSDLEDFKSEFTRCRSEFNTNIATKSQEIIKQAKLYVENIEVKIDEAQNILDARLSSISDRTKDNLLDTTEMGEKFDLKTAASLLPAMDGTEEGTKQLLDCIELYNELLDENGKKLLITYVLKSRLSQNAKMRLEKAYASVDLLVKDIKLHLLTKKSAPALSTQLHTVKQNHRNIQEFGQEIEQLLVNLTLSQADGDDEAVKVLTKVNEKIAINTFANGLKNSEIRTIIKARNYDTLKDAVCAASEVDNSNIQNSQVFHARGKDNNFNRRYNRNNYSNKHFKSSWKNFTYPNNRGHYQRGSRFARHGQGRGQRRGNLNRHNNTYLANVDKSTESKERTNPSEENTLFFRQ